MTDIIDYMRTASASDDAFMGRTHALSAVAVMLTLFAFYPQWYLRLSNGDKSIITLLMFCLVTAGGALLPDLDNTQSTAKSSMGIMGTGISAFMRATSPIIQTVLATPYDRKNMSDGVDAHRGFYHTFISGILIGGVFMFLCSSRFHIGILTGDYMAMLLMFISMDMAISAIIGSIWKSKTMTDMLVSMGITMLASIFIWQNMDHSNGYSIIGLALGLGWIIHIIGDMFTTQGVPALFPIPIKGKFWYDIRVLRIKAGGVIENIVFTPLFIIIIIVCILRMLGLLI